MEYKLYGRRPQTPDPAEQQNTKIFLSKEDVFEAQFKKIWADNPQQLEVWPLSLE